MSYYGYFADQGYNLIPLIGSVWNMYLFHNSYPVFFNIGCLGAFISLVIVIFYPLKPDRYGPSGVNKFCLDRLPF